jgi:organic hydroperoxide reductase OsmC/OhrA
MSEHTIALRYAAAPRSDANYPRSHTWTFTGNQTVRASAVPEYGGEPEHANPEEGLVAAVAGCHMLTFLAVAAKRGYAVTRYEDDPAGTLGKNAEGRMAITHVRLRPRIAFGGEKQPSAEELGKLHEAAHRNCFIANSLRCEVTVE